ncbi:hypothetical protein HUJ05_000887 [Dendroctonus ponderosae]|nr:hypothetical protein HUJ05_000887 [Dendroctonus ponderosae]
MAVITSPSDKPLEGSRKGLDHLTGASRDNERTTETVRCKYRRYFLKHITLKKKSKNNRMQ